jgi:hypothetical protein
MAPNAWCLLARYTGLFNQKRCSIGFLSIVLTGMQEAHANFRLRLLADLGESSDCWDMLITHEPDMELVDGDERQFNT